MCGLLCFKMPLNHTRSGSQGISIKTNMVAPVPAK